MISNITNKKVINLKKEKVKDDEFIDDNDIKENKDVPELNNQEPEESIKNKTKILLSQNNNEDNKKENDNPIDENRNNKNEIIEEKNKDLNNEPEKQNTKEISKSVKVNETETPDHKDKPEENKIKEEIYKLNLNEQAQPDKQKLNIETTEDKKSEIEESEPKDKKKEDTNGDDLKKNKVYVKSKISKDKEIFKKKSEDMINQKPKPFKIKNIETPEDKKEPKDTKDSKEVNEINEEPKINDEKPEIKKTNEDEDSFSDEEILNIDKIKKEKLDNDVDPKSKLNDGKNDNLKMEKIEACDTETSVNEEKPESEMNENAEINKDDKSERSITEDKSEDVKSDIHENKRYLKKESKKSDNSKLEKVNIKHAEEKDTKKSSNDNIKPKEKKTDNEIIEKNEINEDKNKKNEEEKINDKKDDDTTTIEIKETKIKNEPKVNDKQQEKNKIEKDKTETKLNKEDELKERNQEKLEEEEEKDKDKPKIKEQKIVNKRIEIIKNEKPNEERPEIATESKKEDSKLHEIKPDNQNNIFIKKTETNGKEKPVKEKLVINRFKNESDKSNDNENQELTEEKPKLINKNNIIIKKKMIKILRFKNPLKIFINKWKSLPEKTEKETKETDIKNVVITKKKIILNKNKTDTLENPNEVERNEIYKYKYKINKTKKENDKSNEDDIQDSNINEPDKEKDIINSKEKPLRINRDQKKAFVINVKRTIKFKNIIVKIIENHIGIKYYFNIWKMIYANSKKKEKENEKINIIDNIKNRTQIPKRKFYTKIETNELQIEGNEPKANNRTIDTNNRAGKDKYILLKKMNEKRKKRILIKYILKLTEKNEEIIKQYLIRWKNKIKNKTIKKEDEEKPEPKKTVFKRTITYNKNRNPEPIKKETEIITYEKITKTTINSNLYKKHKVPSHAFTSRNNNGQIIKKNSSINSESSESIINKSKNEPNKAKTQYPMKTKKFITTEKSKIVKTKEEVKKFTLPNPKKETTKEFSLIINPMQRSEKYDAIDLNLPLIKKVPKIPQKKMPKKVDITNSRLTRFINRSNIPEKQKFFSPIYKTNRRALESENSDNSPINVERTQVRKRLRFDKMSLSNDISNDTDNNSNTISLKYDKSIKDFGYKTFTFIPRTKITKAKETTVIKMEERNRFDNEEKDSSINDNTKIRKTYKRRIFSFGSNKDKNIENKSKTYVTISKMEPKINKFYLEKGCRKEYNKNKYGDLILCEEIVYKSNDAVPEKVLNISTIKKPTKKLKVKYTQEREEVEVQERQGIFVKRVIDYQIKERKYGYKFTSPIKYPVTPSKNEISVSVMSPFSRTSSNFYKIQQQKRLFSPEASAKDNRNERNERIERIERIERVERVERVDRMERKDKGRIQGIISPSKSPTSSFQVKKIYVKIPKCEKSVTVNYLQKIKSLGVKSNTIMDNINTVPNKEKIVKAKIPDRRFYPTIYKSLKRTQSLIDFHMQFLQEVPHPTFKQVLPEKIYNIINDTNKKLALLQIFYIYAHYKYNKYLIKKTYWNKWKKKVKIFSVNSNNNVIHLKNINGHCFSVQKIVVKEIRCGIHPDSKDFIDCLCFRTKYCLKRILLRHYLLKQIDRKKYYLYKWYKKALRKIRPIGL